MNLNKEKTRDIDSVILKFKLKGSIRSITPYGSGHIHDTYHLCNSNPKYPDYLLQKLNHHVFKNIPALIQNIKLVTSHIKYKLSMIPDTDPEKETLTLIDTFNNHAYFVDENGNYWRMYYFLKNTQSCDRVNTSQQAYEGGKAYGRFQALLADMKTELLSETIPDFHHIGSRLGAFNKAIKEDPKGRVKDIEEEISFIHSRASRMEKVHQMGEQKLIARRITHNDTKFNNVLLNQENKAQCVIDLDTVMPGYIAYDFGDAVRTIVNTAEEDEKDLSKIDVNLTLLNSFSIGFLEETKKFITKHEIESLYHGTFLLPFMIGLRFLTDYVDGDNYFKTKFEEHNLQRARAQFRLVECMEEKQEEILHIIQNATKLTT